MICARQRQPGFSLLEVLVAVAITAMMLGVLYQIFGHSVSTARLRSDYATAIVLAESFLASYPADGAQDAGANLEERFRTRVNVIPFIDPSNAGSVPRFQLVQVTVTVEWDSVDRERTVQLTTLKPIGLL